MISLDELAVLDLLALAPGPMRSACWKRLRLHLQVAPGHDVVEHAHALEQRQVLEGARDAHLGHLVRVHVREASRRGSVIVPCCGW